MVFCFPGVIGEPDHAGRVGAASAYLNKPVVAFLLESLLIPDLDIEIGFPCNLARGLGQEFRGCDSAGLINQGSGFIGGIGDNRVSMEIALIAFFMIFEHRQLYLNLVQSGFFLFIEIKAVATEYGALHSLSDEGNGLAGVQCDRNASKSMVIRCAKRTCDEGFQSFPDVVGAIQTRGMDQQMFRSELRIESREIGRLELFILNITFDFSDDIPDR